MAKTATTIHAVGDRVKVKPGREHDEMTKGKSGTVVSISTPALEIQFDDMEGTHKWYVDDELESLSESSNKKNKRQVKMKVRQSASARPPEPIRCFEGTAKPHEAFWKFRNAAETDSGETEIEFYGPISEFSWWGDEVTPKMFKDQLYANGKNGPVTVRLNSPGGDLIAASVIRATMVDYPGRVTVKIDGLAASAAVMVALGGDRIMIQSSAYMMIHEAMVGLLGLFNIEELKSLIDELKTINAGIVEAYMGKTKMEADQLKKMMADETWMTASEAVAFGFADEVISGSSKMSNVVNFANVLRSHYVNIPKSLLANEMGMDPTSALQDCYEACEQALEYAVECLHQCESCPNVNTDVHQQCIAACQACIESCAVCAHDCEEGVLTAQVLNSLQMCVDACVACETACRACAESCPMCQGACTVCGDACQLCGTVCGQQTGSAAPMQNQHVNIPRALLSSQRRQAGDIERQAQRLAARATTFLIKE